MLTIAKWQAMSPAERLTELYRREQAHKAEIARTVSTWEASRALTGEYRAFLRETVGEDYPVTVQDALHWKARRAALAELAQELEASPKHE